MQTGNRFYRQNNTDSKWITSTFKVDTTDLLIRSIADVSTIAVPLIKEIRHKIQSHIKQNENFLHSLKPLYGYTNNDYVIQDMYSAAEQANVGPMAAVAGTIAEAIGKRLTTVSNEIIIENGRDIFLTINSPAFISIFPGNIFFKDSIIIKLDPSLSPCGVCTSSAKIGNSISFGKADAVTIIAKNTAYADAMATSICNEIKCLSDIENVLSKIQGNNNILGACIIYKDKLAACGNIEFISHQELTNQYN